MPFSEADDPKARAFVPGRSAAWSPRGRYRRKLTGPRARTSQQAVVAQRKSSQRQHSGKSGTAARQPLANGPHTDTGT